MLLLLKSKLDTAVVLFGCGLIGSAIERALRSSESWGVRRLRFPWNENAFADRENAFQQIRSDLREVNTGRRLSVHIIWSAGSAGFSADQSQTLPELRVFREVVQFSESVQSDIGTEVHLHVFSSAGGLFEGVRGIDGESKFRILRPYGELKVAQEEIAAKAATTSCTTYRPTSVYSTIQSGKRLGLIPTVIWNTLSSRTSIIFGNNDTLRDYIWADDIGDFLATRIMRSPTTMGHKMFLLATSIPTSISRIVRLIEQVLLRPVSVQFIVPRDNNSLDITVTPRAIPDGLYRTDLATAIRQIHLRLMSDGMRPNG
jgi:nucleoside-diphosphate-sugar epimerase